MFYAPWMNKIKLDLRKEGENMSKADEMFEKINFKKECFKDIYGNIYSEAYTKNLNYIEFILSNKEIVFDNAYENPVRFDFNEFKLIEEAINEKVKELRLE